MVIVNVCFLVKLSILAFAKGVVRNGCRSYLVWLLDMDSLEYVCEGVCVYDVFRTVCGMHA